MKQCHMFRIIHPGSLLFSHAHLIQQMDRRNKLENQSHYEASWLPEHRFAQIRKGQPLSYRDLYL